MSAEQEPDDRGGAATEVGEIRQPATTSAKRVFKVVLTDVGIPYLVYLLLSRIGLSDVFALAAAGGVSVLQVGFTYLRRRAISALSVLIITRFSLGVVAGLITGDARMVLVKDSIITGSVGVVAAVSLLLARPMTYYIRRDFAGDPGSWDESWARSARFRQVNRVTTIVWAVGLIAEATIRIGLAFRLPLDIAAIASPTLGALSILALVTWTQWYGRRTQESVRRDLASRS
ncbi:VC0807 family protein [Amycolatopsis anabasis]|uniref:VC0807 family protein n=1 Tax=Amycolatopsis anabasis TaxID=1840409 RepID=UPI00131BCD92|nr:VC0807 family protein [Amycolatopsis anabasis]